MTKTISVRFSDDEFEDLESLVESEGYDSKTALVRELIKKRWDSWAKDAVRNRKENPDEYESWEAVKKRMFSDV